MAVKCKASESYLKAMKGENNLTIQTSPKLRPNFAQTINESVENGIIELIKENSKITQVEMAKILGVSRDQIKRNIKKLKDANKISRIGNRNSGYWKIL